MTVRWVVRAGDGATVADVVARAGGDAAAVGDGRVFVGRRRVTDAGDAVAPGDEVTIAPKVESEGADVRLIMRGRGWVAFDKPAGMPTIADHAGASHALVAVAAKALGVEPAALHPTSRLDHDVSGVVIFATDPRAANRLKRAREEGRHVRRYLALAARAPAIASGAWDAPIGRGKDPRHRAVNGRDPTSALTRFAVVARAPGRDEVLLALAPVTGRTHQLRVHASHAGAPLLGDRVYGGPTRVTLANGRVVSLGRVALHCARVHADERTVESAVPGALRDVWLALGGADEAWEKGVTCSLD